MPETRTEMMLDKGLANTVAAESRMSFIDGENGVLEYVGIDIDSLARSSTFEETVYLLWHRRLPTQAELDGLTAAIRAEYGLPEPMWEIIRQIPAGVCPRRASWPWAPMSRRSGSWDRFSSRNGPAGPALP